MSHSWRSGDFDRAKLGGAVRHFAPAHAADHLVQIDLQRLWDRGKRLLLLDVDNTLVQWKAENFAPEVIDWIERAKAMGFEICIISNTRREERLARLSQLLGVATVRGRFKPSRAMYRLALIKFKRKPEEAIMVGDQMMTDVFGANRAGIDAIWVRKMEGNEFKGTRINRAIERFLTGYVYRALVVPPDFQENAPAVDSKLPFWQRSIFLQLVKFGVVGGSSFLIDYCVRMTLAYGLPSGNTTLGDAAGRSLQASLPAVFGRFQTPTEAFWPLAVACGACVAMINSFFLNRLWTFQIRGHAERLAQFRRFIAVSMIGMLINVFFSTLFNHILPGNDKGSARIATLLATVFVAIWNFTGQRLYAFRAARQSGGLGS
ncbi:YqeG family HAD IIIA-type phosphatase [bacterium]|nr:MAG: YqeG family HAD IIIA-type phosphatase [bacterium]